MESAATVSHYVGKSEARECHCGKKKQLSFLEQLFKLQRSKVSYEKAVFNVRRKQETKKAKLWQILISLTSDSN